jgi:malonyl CoA-acyl carrier protein transacylase
MKIAFLCPGQGSQAVGMGAAFADASKAAAAIWQEADEALGFSLSRLCREGPESDLLLTANTQPAVLTATVAAAARSTARTTSRGRTRRSGNCGCRRCAAAATPTPPSCMRKSYARRADSA